jgi:hypothetical protein
LELLFFDELLLVLKQSNIIKNRIRYKYVEKKDTYKDQYCKIPIFKIF